MRVRGALPWLAAALLLLLPPAAPAATAADVTDLTGETPAAEMLVQALTVQDAAPGALARVALRVPFAPGSARLTDEARGTLDALVQALGAAELAGQFFLVEGHSDASGTENQNNRLSTARAGAVLDYLVAAGVDPERLALVGYGERQPLPGLDPGDERNRRIQITTQRLAPSAVTPALPQDLVIALGYQVHVQRPDGSHGIVDPTEGPFRAGDRVTLTFAASMTGVFDAYRLDAGGAATAIGSWTVDRGQILRLPAAPDAFTFDGPGTTLVVLQYHPCATARTAFIDLRAELRDALPPCAEMAERAFQADRSGDLAVESDDEGSRALVALPAEAVPAAAFNGLSLAIPLAHR